LLVLQLSAAPSAPGAPVAFPAPARSGVAPCATLRLDRDAEFFLDEDNFQFAPATDQNYTLGTGITWGGDEGPDVGAHPLLAAPPARRGGRGRGGGRGLCGAPLPQTPRPQHYARTLFASAFTPQHIERPDIQLGDRPYAFLLGWTVARSPDVTHAGRPSFSFW